MLTACRLATVLLLSCLAMPATAAPPDDARLQRLFELTNVEKDYAHVVDQMEAMQLGLIEQSLPDATPESRAKMQRFFEEQQAELRQVLAWEKMLPVYLEVYRQTYEVQDIEAMIARARDHASAQIGGISGERASPVRPVLSGPGSRGGSASRRRRRDCHESAIRFTCRSREECAQ